MPPPDERSFSQQLQDELSGYVEKFLKTSEKVKEVRAADLKLSKEQRIRDKEALKNAKEKVKAEKEQLKLAKDRAKAEKDALKNTKERSAEYKAVQKVARDLNRSSEDFNKSLRKSLPSLEKMAAFEMRRADALSRAAMLVEKRRNSIGRSIDKAFDKMTGPKFKAPRRGGFANPDDVHFVSPGPRGGPAIGDFSALPPPLPPKPPQFAQAANDKGALARLAASELQQLAVDKKQLAALEHADPMKHVGLPNLGHPPSASTNALGQFSMPTPKAGFFGEATPMIKKAASEIGALLGKSISSAAGAAWSGVKESGISVLSILKKTLLATWDYIDTKVLPVQGMLNKSLGATTTGLGQLRGQAMRTGDVFQDLGLGFEQGARDVAVLGAQLKDAYIPQKNLDSLLKMAEYVGAGAEETGHFARSFQASGGTLEELDKVMKNATVDAKKFNVPVNLIRKDMLDNIEVMQRFGSVNATQFSHATTRAQALGLSVGQLFSTFGEHFDTFENANDLAATLNQTLGTNLDSIKLLNETNIEKRYEMIAKSLKDVNQEWDTMGTFQQNIFKSLLSINNEQGAAYFGSQKQRMEGKKRAEQDKANIKTTDDWNNALQRLRKQYLSVELETQKLFIALGNLIGRFFGSDGAVDFTKKGLDGFKGVMRGLSDLFNNIASKLPKNNDGFGQIKGWITDLTGAVMNLGSAAENIIEFMERTTQPFDTKTAEGWMQQYTDAKNDPAKLFMLNKALETNQDASNIFYRRESHLTGKPESSLRSALQTASPSKDNYDYQPMSEYDRRRIEYFVKNNITVQVGSKDVAAAVQSEMAKQSVAGAHR